MCTIYVIEEHDQVLDLWRVQQARSLRILHLDAHCDMRGLLIDRRIQCVYRIWDKNPQVDPGNFLSHAIIEGRVSSLRWVYNELGGRQNDVGTVKYESDLTAMPCRWFLALRGERGIPIHYEAIREAMWTGLAEDEFVDIDWDYFAPMGSQEKAIQERVEKFLGIDFLRKPKEVYVCYSPQFSQPSRVQFQKFITDLASILKAEVIHLPHLRDSTVIKSFYKKFFPVPLVQFTRKVYYKVNLNLRKWGIY